MEIEYPKKGINSKVLIKSKNIDVTLFNMARNTEMDEHTSTKRAIVQVLEGKGIFNLDGENMIMKPGVIINMPKNAVHSLKAKKNTSFLLTLTK